MALYHINLPLAFAHCLCLVLPQEEDEVPDDETVNQMIARSEEEFEQFMVSHTSISVITWTHL